METSNNSFIFEVDENLDWQKESICSSEEGKIVVENVLDDYTHFNDF